MFNGNRIKSYFQIDPKVTFLNHGSFGAVPLPVQEVQREWQQKMEKQPVEFLGRKINTYLSEAREKIGHYLGTNKDNLVFVPNATHGINIVVHSLHLPPGSEILTTDHEYGAMDRTWHFNAKSTGWIYRPLVIPLPVDDPGVLVNDLFSKVNAQTRVIFLSHISSPTSIIFPIREICQRARELGILTIIDGAHVPGQLDLDLDDLGADFYTGNFHKWLCAPKGSAFLYARPEMQAMIDPLVVSWGYESLTPGISSFHDYLEWTGTQDFSSYLSVPAAIDFQNGHQWNKVRSECHELARQTWLSWEHISHLPQLYANASWFGQMVTLPVPDKYPPDELKVKLLDQFGIEIPVIEWNNRLFLRLSVQGYNTLADMDRLIQALTALFA